MESKKVKIRIGDKDFPTVCVHKKRMVAILNYLGIEEGIIFKKGETASIKIAEELERQFKVKKDFKLLGYTDDKLVVTIPITLDTLKGLGFVSSVSRS